MDNNVSWFDSIVADLNSYAHSIGSFSRYSSALYNWYDLAFYASGLKRSVILRPKHGEPIGIASKEDYRKFRETNLLYYSDLIGSAMKINNGIVTLRHKGATIKMRYGNPRQLKQAVRVLYGRFIEEDYAWLNVKGKLVIDVGASVGDTALYFASRGAKHVYAFEPYPYSFALAKRNISLNRLNGMISMLNEGCGGKNSSVTVQANYSSTGSSRLKSFSRGRRVRISTLAEIVKRFGVHDGVLKVDCEGCEYGLLLNADKETLRKFSQIAIEYHLGYRNLDEKLSSCGFEVRHTPPKSTMESGDRAIIGLIFAERV